MKAGDKVRVINECSSDFMLVGELVSLEKGIAIFNWKGINKTFFEKELELVELKEMIGGIKNDKKDDKLPMELIPVESILGYAEVMRMGAKKYSPRNWEKGIKYSRLYAAAIRHLLAWFMGEDKDTESGLSHLKHAFWNVGALIAFTERGRKELDDRENIYKS